MSGATLAAAIAGTTGGAGAGVFDFSSGSGSITIPASATGVTIEVWGAGGGGGYGTVTNIFGEFAYEPQENPGGGGGGGAYVKTVLVLTAPDAGKTILYTVGAAGNGGSFGDAVGGAGGQSVAYAGTYALPEMIATGGLWRLRWNRYLRQPARGWRYGFRRQYYQHQWQRRRTLHPDWSRAYSGRRKPCRRRWRQWWRSG